MSGFRGYKMALVKGDRTVHVKTFNPSSADPRQEIYVDISKLKDTSRLVAGSLHILFDFQVTGDRSWFLNNLFKLGWWVIGW